MIGGCDGQAETLVRRRRIAGRPARQPPAGRLGVRHPPRPDPGRPCPQGLHRPAALLRPHLRHRQPARPGLAGAPAAVRHSGRDVGRVQHGHPVRRRQVALADGAVSPGPSRRAGQVLERRGSDSRKGEIKTVPEAAVAVFMGKEFDSLQGAAATASRSQDALGRDRLAARRQDAVRGRRAARDGSSSSRRATPFGPCSRRTGRC